MNQTCSRLVLVNQVITTGISVNVKSGNKHFINIKQTVFFSFSKNLTIGINTELKSFTDFSQSWQSRDFLSRSCVLQSKKTGATVQDVNLSSWLWRKVKLAFRRKDREAKCQVEDPTTRKHSNPQVHNNRMLLHYLRTIS